jgi:subtilase family serine protease
VVTFAKMFGALSAEVVGATQGPEEGSARKEVACSSSNNNTFITSGGGFSTAFSRPAYQASAVSTFLAREGHALGGGYDATGRGYPDVALIGHLYPVIIGGDEQVKDGTSASTPVMAAIIALANSRRLALGKPPVGFANPALYAWGGDGSIFHDIVDGQNNCCAGGWSGATPPICCPINGFVAGKGWDAVTGLGSVNAGSLIEAWAAL